VAKQELDNGFVVIIKLLIENKIKEQERQLEQLEEEKEDTEKPEKPENDKKEHQDQEC